MAAPASSRWRHRLSVRIENCLVFLVHVWRLDKHTHTHDISSNRRRICDEKRTTDKRAVYNERPTHTVHTHCNLAFCVRIYYYFRNTHNAREIDVIPFLVKWQRLPAEHSGAMTSFIAERVTTWSCGIYENKFLACEMSGRARCSGLFLSSTTQ